MSAYFKEDGLVLDQQEVLLAAVQCAEARAPSLTIDNVQYPTAHLSGNHCHNMQLKHLSLVISTKVLESACV